MSDRDRLIELIEEWADNPKDVRLADYLIANGATVSPVPIGSTVYEIRARGIRTIITSSRKCDCSIVNDRYFKNAKEYNLEFYVKAKKFVKYDKTRWNKTVFATKEQAEQALKECEGK